MSKKIKLFLCFLLCLACCFLVFAESNDSSALRLILKRVVMEDSKRAEVLTLINGSDEEETYRLLWREMVMTPNEGLKPPSKLENPPVVPPAKDMIKYSPRRVTLQPGTSQQIRMVLRTPSGLADGEYRSHLWIKKEVEVEKLHIGKEPPLKPRSAKVEITLLPGVTIPVIVRKGDLSVKVSVGDASVVSKSDKLNVSFTLLREGQKSTYGDVDFYCNPNGESYPLQSMRGIAIYTELNQKYIKGELSNPKGKSACREILIRYVETSDYAGEPVKILAEKIVSVK